MFYPKMAKTSRYSILLIPILVLFSSGALHQPEQKRNTWDKTSLWTMNTNTGSSGKLFKAEGIKNSALGLEYELGGGHGFVELTYNISKPISEETPITFFVKADNADGADLEIKLVDINGSVFGRRVPIGNNFREWTPITIYRQSVEYWWGGDDNVFDALAKIQLVVSKKGRGTIAFDDVGTGQPGTAATFSPAGPVLDPDRELHGIGFRQRRAAKMIPEDPLILEGLKVLQDSSSPDQRLLPSMQNNEAHTFNNMLVAMAFLVKGERERAERILDFYAERIDPNNKDQWLQNFFFQGEKRGFFQAVALNPANGVDAYHMMNPNDRWMGDMAWMLCALKYHEKRCNSDRYAELQQLVLGLMKEWYTDAPDGTGGYVRHGWRKGDSKLHEKFGHPEGNIDAYAVFRLYGEHDRAEKIRTWLDRVLKGNSLPLDLYTWRALAYGPEAASILNVPDYDLRYRKVVNVNGEKVMGLYVMPDMKANNSWLDGVGHIACAYFAVGNPTRGNFYSNQIDPFIIEETIANQKIHSIPFTANKTGHEWVDLNKGFVSVAAWYIFAKNKFNPMTLETAF